MVNYLCDDGILWFFIQLALRYQKNSIKLFSISCNLFDEVLGIARDNISWGYFGNLRIFNLI